MIFHLLYSNRDDISLVTFKQKYIFTCYIQIKIVFHIKSMNYQMIIKFITKLFIPFLSPQTVPNPLFALLDEIHSQNKICTRQQDRTV